MHSFIKPFVQCLVQSWVKFRIRLVECWTKKKDLIHSQNRYIQIQQTLHSIEVYPHLADTTLKITSLTRFNCRYANHPIHIYKRYNCSSATSLQIRYSLCMVLLHLRSSLTHLVRQLHHLKSISVQYSLIIAF